MHWSEQVPTAADRLSIYTPKFLTFRRYRDPEAISVFLVSSPLGSTVLNLIMLWLVMFFFPGFLFPINEGKKSVLFLLLFVCFWRAKRTEKREAFAMSLTDLPWAWYFGCLRCSLSSPRSYIYNCTIPKCSPSIFLLPRLPLSVPVIWQLIMYRLVAWSFNFLCICIISTGFLREKIG